MSLSKSILIQYKRTPGKVWSASLTANIEHRFPPIPKRIFGNFMEHLGFSLYGGLLAQELSNPIFARDINLLPQDIQDLLRSGKYLTDLFISGGNPKVVPPLWIPGINATGFGVMALDDATALGIPFPWAPIGQPGCVSASVGRIGGAMRIKSIAWINHETNNLISLENGPAGIRQGVFLPLGRVLDYTGFVWARLATLEAISIGQIEIGIRRRIGHSGSEAGERLAWDKVSLSGSEWVKLPFKFSIPSSMVKVGEPLDFYLRWLPQENPELDILIDQVSFSPADAIDGMDPEVIRMVKEWPVPLLRWPGGNFVSHYHWRDGVGPMDLRQVRPNYAWNGLEYNLFGTDEFIRFCRLIDAEPQITVNTGTGTPEEAASWVEYCNGSSQSRMGRLRAENGCSEPYNIKLWEVGNETFGNWQGGYHGSDENARRYVEFAKAMRENDPNLELIATGNAFDFAQPGPRYDNVCADRRWHQQLIKQSGDLLDVISLHCLPVNDVFLEHSSSEEVFEAIMAQPTTWEQIFLPQLLQVADKARGKSKKETPLGQPLRIAITEWGILGTRRDRPYVDNFGEAVYAGLFLNMMIRNSKRISIANATALLHGGCIRRAGGEVYYDPQYTVIHKYSRMIGAEPLACRLESPGYDIQVGTDLGAPQSDIPYVDGVICWSSSNISNTYKGLQIAIVNRHLNRPIGLDVHLPDLPIQQHGLMESLSHNDPSAKVTPALKQHFPLKVQDVFVGNGILSITLPACSISWIQIPERKY